MTDISFEEGMTKYHVVKLPVTDAYTIEVGFVFDVDDSEDGLKLQTNYTMHPEIIDWISDNIKQEWGACVHNDEALFGFISPKEATQFRMRF